MLYCSNCGKEIGGNDSFCGHCGKRIQDSSTNQPSAGSTQVNIQTKSVEENQRNAVPSISAEKQHARTKVTFAILGGIFIALIILALVLAKSNVFNQTASTGTSSENQGVNSEQLSQTDLQNNYSEDNDDMEFRESRSLQRSGIVANGRPYIETDKTVYYYGERIKVYYYNAPGYSRDWICIVPEGSGNTVVGKFHYIPRGGRGEMIFTSPRPGRYEARAYYSYSPFQYAISARYRFTVVDHPAN
jgi:hypothetical protein